MAFTLDDIREQAEQKFGSFDIDLGPRGTLKLRNPLRLSKAERDALRDREGDEDEDGDDQEEKLRELIRLVADDKDKADALLAQIGDDLAMLATIVKGYSNGVGVGEA